MRKQDGPRQVSEPSICYCRREKDKDEENSDYTGRRTICSGRFLRLQRSQDKGMLLAGGCGHTDGPPQIDKTRHLEDAYQFGKTIYA